MSIRPDANDTFIFIPQSSYGAIVLVGSTQVGNGVNLGAAGTITLGGDVQFLDDGLLLPAVKTDDTDDGLLLPAVVNNGGDIILSSIGTLGDRPDANDTFIFIPETSPAGAYGATANTITMSSPVPYLDDGLLLPAVQTDDDDGAATVGSLRVTKAGAVTLTATLADGTANGGDIILTSIGGLGGDTSSSLADWTIL